MSLRKKSKKQKLQVQGTIRNRRYDGYGTPNDSQSTFDCHDSRRVPRSDSRIGLSKQIVALSMIIKRFQMRSREFNFRVSTIIDIIFPISLLLAKENQNRSQFRAHQINVQRNLLLAVSGSTFL